MIASLEHKDWLSAIWIIVIGLSAMSVYSRMTDVAVKGLVRRCVDWRDERSAVRR